MGRDRGRSLPGMARTVTQAEMRRQKYREKGFKYVESYEGPSKDSTTQTDCDVEAAKVRKTDCG